MKMLAAELILVRYLIDRLVRFHDSPPLNQPHHENEVPLNEVGGFTHIDELKEPQTGAIENIDHDGQKTRIKGAGGIERTGKQFTQLPARYPVARPRRSLPLVATASTARLVFAK
jgi:hypothetical protein